MMLAEKKRQGIQRALGLGLAVIQPVKHEQGCGQGLLAEDPQLRLMIQVFIPDDHLLDLGCRVWRGEHQQLEGVFVGIDAGPQTRASHVQLLIEHVGIRRRGRDCD